MENKTRQTGSEQNKHRMNPMAYETDKVTPEYTPNLEYDFFRANSATDCTGSVPRPPQTDDELDSYLDVYNFLPQCAIARDRKED